MRAIRITMLVGVFATLLILGKVWLHRDVRSHSVTLSWQAPPSTRGIIVVGYNVYRSERPEAEYSRIVTRVRESRYQDRMVNDRRTYSYVVTALDQVGRESKFSGEVKVQVP
jgi:fibronectin type 3 domain-containing protein